MRIQDHADMIYACGRCNFCRGMDFSETCPQIFNQRWESASLRGKVAITRGILEGKLDYAEDLAERVFGCFLCRRCSEECKKAGKIEVVPIVKAMRADFIDRGIDVPEPANNMVEAVTESGNMFKDSPRVHSEWSEGLELKEDSPVLFFAGCIASHRFKETTSIIVRVLQAAGYELNNMKGEEVCCGNPYIVTGYLDRAAGWAEENVERLQGRGVKEIITGCPGCYRTFKEEYGKLLDREVPFRVRHVTEVLAEIVEHDKLDLKIPIYKRLTYHDPCELGRYMGIYEPPRKVISAIPGIKFKEMRRNREQGFCCGGGGGVKITYPDQSLSVSVERLNDALEVDAEIVTTACPACELNLTHATYNGDLHIRILDLSELLAVSAGIVDSKILEWHYFPED